MIGKWVDNPDLSPEQGDARAAVVFICVIAALVLWFFSIVFGQLWFYVTTTAILLFLAPTLIGSLVRTLKLAFSSPKRK
jgi:hypothetical protein